MRRVDQIDNMVPVRNVVITVFDKTGLNKLVPGLVEINPDITIYSTGGTYAKIKEMMKNDPDYNIREVSAYTGQPETEGGLVKTLHHKLFLGYLTETHCEAHQADLKREDAKPIDMFVGNLYPFQQAVSKPGIDIEDARMNIDVGGPSALRAAAKNWHRVATVVDPADYELILRELESNGGCTTAETRFNLHKKTFKMLGEYDSAIAKFLDGVEFKDARKAYSFMS